MVMMRTSIHILRVQLWRNGGNMKSLSNGLKTIVSVNSIAAVITLIFWLLIIFKVYLGSGNEIMMDTVSKASTLGFLIADLIWAVPMLIISVPGLLKLSSWGWTAAQMANILWMYSLTSLWVRDLYIGLISPGDYLFLPFALFSIWSAYYLWLHRSQFNIQS